MCKQFLKLSPLFLTLNLIRTVGFAHLDVLPSRPRESAGDQSDRRCLSSLEV